MFTIKQREQLRDLKEGEKVVLELPCGTTLRITPQIPAGRILGYHIEAEDLRTFANVIPYDDESKNGIGISSRKLTVYVSAGALRSLSALGYLLSKNPRNKRFI